MRERLSAALRPIGMRRALLIVVMLASVVGCGDAAGPAPRSATTTSDCVDAAAAAPAPPPVAAVDFDGDGTSESVSYVPPTGSCPGALITTVRGRDMFATVADNVPVRPTDAAVLAIPGRKGQLLLVM